MQKLPDKSLDKTAIAACIPHAGAMVLLDSATGISPDGLECYSSSHLNKDNPLLTERGLSASSGIEYAAQAMALHISLLNTGRLTGGYLAICKNIELMQPRLDIQGTTLEIRVDYLSGSVDLGLLQYSFVIQANKRRCQDKKILSGELSIVIKKQDTENV